MVEAANAQLQAAKGASELAQLALKEYQEGIVKQEQLQGCAQDELKHLTPKIERAKERYAKIQAASKGSAYDLSQEWRFEIGHRNRGMERGPWTSSLMQTGSTALKAFREYRITRAPRSSPPISETARSHELAGKATWAVEQSRLRKMQRALSDPPRLTDHQKRMLTILDAAIPIEEQLSKRSPNARKRETLASRSARNSRPWPGLAAVVEEGRDEEADAALATLQSECSSVLNLRRP